MVCFLLPGYFRDYEVWKTGGSIGGLEFRGLFDLLAASSLVPNISFVLPMKGKVVRNEISIRYFFLK